MNRHYHIWLNRQGRLIRVPRPWKWRSSAHAHARYMQLNPVRVFYCTDNCGVAP